MCEPKPKSFMKEGVPVSGTTLRVLSRKDDDRVIPALFGKTVVIVTDDRDMNIENKVTKMVLCDAGTSSDSRPMGYSDFFSSPPLADLLILRSSRVFSIRTDDLLSSLRMFRALNPRSAVMVCAFEGSIIRKLEPLVDAGVVNLVEGRPPSDDFALLRMGAAVLQKLQAL